MYNGVLYSGGGNSTGAGNPPGGGGAGDTSGSNGQPGAAGQAWIVARQSNSQITPFSDDFQSKGVGTQNNDPSWLHPGMNGNCLLGVLSGYSATALASQTFAMACDGAPMTLLGSQQFFSGSGLFSYALLFQLETAVPVDDATITWSSTATQSGMSGNTFCFQGIASVGVPPLVQTGTGQNFVHGVNGSTPSMVLFQFFSDSATGGIFSSYSQNDLWDGSGAGAASALTVGDALGVSGSTVTFSAQGAGGSGASWISMVVPLNKS